MMLNLENEELSSGVEVNSDAESSSVTDDMFEGCTNKHKVPHSIIILLSCVYASLNFVTQL